MVGKGLIKLLTSVTPPKGRTLPVPTLSTPASFLGDSPHPAAREHSAMLCLVALNPTLGFQAASVRSSRPALLASRASPSAMLLDAGTSTFLADAQILLDTAGTAVATGAAAAGDAAAAAPAADPSWFDRCARIGHGPAPPTSQPPQQRLEAHPPPWLRPAAWLSSRLSSSSRLSTTGSRALVCRRPGARPSSGSPSVSPRP